MDYKRLLTQVERTLEQINSDSITTTVSQIADTIATNFRVELGITGGRVYEVRDDYYMVALPYLNKSGYIRRADP